MSYHNVTVFANKCGCPGEVFLSPAVYLWCCRNPCFDMSQLRSGGLLESVGWAMRHPSEEFAQLVRAADFGETVWVYVVRCYFASRRHLYVHFPHEQSGRMHDPEIPF